MDLALLVYGISLLHPLGAFIIGLGIMGLASVGFFFIWRISECDAKSYYSERENKERLDNGVMCEKWIKRGVGVAVTCFFLMIFVPTEKTAYTMVGAYAAQKVAENDKVQQMSGKVLTIIEQKLDSYIEDGVKEIEDKAEKAKKKK